MGFVDPTVALMEQEVLEGCFAETDPEKIAKNILIMPDRKSIELVEEDYNQQIAVL
jgi:hypothetical protein